VNPSFRVCILASVLLGLLAPPPGQQMRRFEGNAPGHKLSTERGNTESRGVRGNAEDARKLEKVLERGEGNLYAPGKLSPEELSKRFRDSMGIAPDAPEPLYPSTDAQEPGFSPSLPASQRPEPLYPSTDAQELLKPSTEAKLARLRDVLKSLETRSSDKNWGDAGAWLEGEIHRGGEPLVPPVSDISTDPRSKITRRPSPFRNWGDGHYREAGVDKDLVDASVEAGESRAAEFGPRVPVTVDGLNEGEWGPAEATLRRVVMLGKLNGLPEALAKVVPGDPSATEEAFGGLDVKALPDEFATIFRPLEALQGLDGLRIASEAVLAPLDVSAIRRDASRVAGGLKQTDVPNRLLTDLAVKSFLDGYATQARTLLPDQVVPGHAAALLDDVRTLLLGEGRVATATASRAIAPDPTASPGSPRGPPPGALSLIPDAAHGSWKVEVPADVPRSLLSTDEVAGIQRRLKAQVTEQLAAKQNEIRSLETRTLGEVTALRETVDTRITQRSEQIRTIEDRLGRALDPYERDLAYDRFGQKGDSVASVADEIQKRRQKMEERDREAERIRQEYARQEKVRAERALVEQKQMQEMTERIERAVRERGRELGRTIERAEVIKRAEVEVRESIRPRGIP